MKKLQNNTNWLICLSILLFATALTYAQTTPENRGRKSPVDFKADFIRPVKVGDSSAINLLGNVVFHHKDNGTIITCDSAIRYNNTRIECFKNVVVNKQDTYLYGDRVDYNGESNLANVYGPIIKMVNKEAIMYTHKFAFNTLTNIGTFGGGATMSQRDNLLESNRGYFHADSSILVCVDDVEIKNPDYKLQSDSVEYNLNTDIATFYTQTYIWNSKGEILSAKSGEYDQRETTYNFTSDSYILTKKQELWSDTLYYDSKAENAVLYNNIQMLDDDKKVMLFGNFAEYWGDPGDALITKSPSLINFDPQQPDTLYMRSDTIFILTVSTDSLEVTDSTNVEVEYIEDGVTKEEPTIESDSASTVGMDSTSIATVENNLLTPDSLGVIIADSTVLASDSTTVEVEEVVELTRSERRKLKRELKREKRESKKRAKEAEERAARALKKRERFIADSLEQASKDSLNLDTIQDSLLTDSLATIDPVIEKDSVQQVIKAYNNVRIYRKDFQAVCDSLVGFSSDSTLHLYINPVLWNEANQITSTKVDIFTKNQAMDKAVFIGEPIMASKIAGGYFNQVKGQTIEAIMVDNEIKRTEVIGNGQTYYYMQDDKDGSIKGFMTVESANITFTMDSSTVETINYKVNPTYTLYPMDQIPISQEIILPGFKWEEARRPMHKSSVFNRTIKSTRRYEYEAKSIPLFDITKRIFEEKSMMIKDGVWRERNEKISESTLSGM